MYPGTYLYFFEKILGQLVIFVNLLWLKLQNSSKGYQSVRFQTTGYQIEIGSNHRVPPCNLPKKDTYWSIIQYMANIFGSATTEEENFEKYIIHTLENIHFGPSYIIYMGNIFCSIKILK